ncbi:MAG: ABC transporter permease [Bacteroidota bacterium]
MNNLQETGRTHHSWWWPWKMAWRDARNSKSKLLLFILAIALGIAALVGITSFRENLLVEINNQAKTLLGADVSVRGNQLLPDSLLAAHSIYAKDMSRECYFASMAFFPRTDGTRLTQVRALSGNYPYYGAISTIPEEAAKSFLEGQNALVDEKLMIQYNVELDDSVKVGNVLFRIVGKLRKIPGQTDVSSTAAPVVYIPFNYLDQTGLIKKGSRINYLHYYIFNDGYQSADTTQTWEDLKEFTEKKGYDVDTVEDEKRQTSRSFKDLTDFLELVAFVALLLGCIGVASSIYVYTKEKTSIVATLRCLGITSRQAIQIYLIQVSVFGLIGSILGTFLGVSVQVFLPELLQDFIPISFTSSISWPSIFTGIAIGLIVSVLFALLSLVSLRLVSPLQAIRSEIDESGKFDKMQGIVALFLFAFINLLVYLQIDSWTDSLIFTAGLLGALAILGLIGAGLRWVIKKSLSQNVSFAWRQGLSNLYRPHNQTTILIITLGLGTSFIATVLFMQNMLIEKVSFSGAGDRPNTVLFDIQTPQKDEVKALTLDYDLPVIQEVPIVTMRLKEINGVDQKESEQDTTIHRRSWVYNREYRVTYRDSLIDSESITQGEWIGHMTGDSIPISISSGYADNLDVKLGDKILWNVQGALVETYVSSFREIDWRRVQTNFLVLFPTGVLENAPQFHVLITKIDNTEVSARYQQAVVRNYPNISIIDLELVLKTLDEILGKIAFVIRFMALFSIGTGIIMLISSIILSRFQRMKENVLLRTLGASRVQLWKVVIAEYFFLGILGSLTGILLALIFSTVLAQFVFELTYIPDFLQILLIILIVTSATVIIGLFNNQSVISRSPLEVLRRAG